VREQSWSQSDLATRAEINELITQLEGQSPNPKPTEVRVEE